MLWTWCAELARVVGLLGPVAPPWQAEPAEAPAADADAGGAG
jgi:hypothetical protein